MICIHYSWWGWRFLSLTMIHKPEEADGLFLCVCFVQKADDREKRQEAHRFHFDAMWRRRTASWENIGSCSAPPAPRPPIFTRFYSVSFQGPTKGSSFAPKCFFLIFFSPRVRREIFMSIWFIHSSVRSTGATTRLWRRREKSWWRSLTSVKQGFLGTGCIQQSDR